MVNYFFFAAYNCNGLNFRSATLEDIYRHYDDSRRIGTEDVPVPIGIPEVRIPAGLSYGSELAHLQHPFGSFPQRGYHFGKVNIHQFIIIIRYSRRAQIAG